MKLMMAALLLFPIMQGFTQIPELIFHSGFEPASRDTTDGVASDIYGVDNSVSPPNDWVYDLEAHPNIGDFGIQYQGGDDTMRWARIIPDPTDSTNSTLSYWLKYPNVGGSKGRIQANLYGNNNLYEVYQEVRLYLPNDWNIIKTATGTINWLTIMEFWNNLPFQDTIHPFRITLGIHKKDIYSQKLTFSLEAQTMPDPPPWPIIWAENDTSFSIPVEQWMTLEIYFKEGDSANGRFSLAVIPDGGQKQIIFDVTNYTHHPNDNAPDGLTRYNPMKLYTSDDVIDYVRNNGGVLQVYWDDFELWKDTNIVAGISKNDTYRDYKIYPNPMGETAILEFSNPAKENLALILYDVQGRIVKTIKDITTDHVVIEKENLGAGLYFVQLSTRNKIIVVGKLIVE